MSAVGIKELKNRLSHYLRRTKQGEEVVITERGKPIALIQPMQSVERAASLDTRGACPAGRSRPGNTANPRASAPSTPGKGYWSTDLTDYPGRSPMNYLDTSALIKRFVAEPGSLLTAALLLFAVHEVIITIRDNEKSTNPAAVIERKDRQEATATRS